MALLARRPYSAARVRDKLAADFTAAQADAAIARLEDSDSVKNYETRFLAKDGQTRHVLLTLSLHMDPNGDNCFPSTRLRQAPQPGEQR